MRAALLGIAAIILASVGFSAPASALPFAGAVGASAGGSVEQARVVSRRIIRGPRCETLVTKRRGRFGRTVVVRERRCF